MAKIVTVDGQKYQIGVLGGIRKVGADGKPTGGAVTDPRLRSKIRNSYVMSGSEVPKTNSKPKDKKVPTGMGDRKTKPSVSPISKPPVPKAKAKPKSPVSTKKVPKPKTDGNRQAYRPGRGDSEMPKKDAKNPNAAFNTARDKQRRAGKKIEALSNKTVRDTSIKDARPARGPAYDTKAPAKQKPNARALKQIQDRKDKSKNPLSKVMLNKITKELKEGGKPVYNDGMVVGVTHKGLIGTVYTGRPQFNPIKKKKK